MKNLALLLCLFLLLPSTGIAQKPLTVPESASEWVRQGEAAYEAGQYQEAAADFTKAVDLEAVTQPQAAGKHLNTLGMIYTLRLKQPLKAIEVYQRGLGYARQAQEEALELKLLDNLAYAYEGQKEHAKALAAFGEELALERKLGTEADQIRTLNTMAGIEYLYAADYGRTAELYEQELALQKKQRDATGVLETLNHLQSVYFLAENYGKCAETRAQQLAAQREAGDEAGALKTLTVLGSLYFRAGLYEKAVPAYEELLRQQQADKDQAGEARTLNGLAGSWVKLRQPEKAIELLGQSLAIYRTLGDRAKTEHTLVDLGIVQTVNLRGYAQGIAFYTEALAMQREDKDVRAQADTLNKLGVVYQNWDKYAKALSFCQQALSLQQSIQDWEGAANSMTNIASAYTSLDQPDKALSIYKQAVSLMRQAKNKSGEASALANLGVAYDALSDYPQAIRADQQALALRRALKDPQGEATVLNNLANIYRNQGNYAQALQTMKQVVAVFHTLGDAKHEATTQMNLGEVYSELGQYDKAIEIYAQVLTTQKQIGDLSGIVVTLGNLGAAASKLGHNEEAVGYYTQSLALAREQQDQAGEATARTNLGNVQGDLGQTDKAIASFRQALAIFTEIKDDRSAAATLNDLGVIYNHTNQTIQAADTYVQALQIQRRIGDRNGEAATLGNLMILWQPTQPALAIWCGKGAINIYQEIRGSLQAQADDPAEELQKGFAASKESVYRDLADVLITQGRLTEARQVLRMLKQEEFFDYLGRDPKAAPALQQRVPLTADESEGQKRYAALAPEASLTPLFEEMTIALRPSRSAKDRIPQSSETGGLSQTLLTQAPGTVALYTIVEPDKYRVIIVTSAFQRAAEYPIRAKELYAKVFAFRNALQDPTRDPRPLAQDLYKIMLGPIEADLKEAHATTLLWSLDDALRYLPVSALHDGQSYLVERYSMSIFTPAGESRLAAGSVPQWRGLGLGVSQAHDDFPALPGVPLELGGIWPRQAGQAGAVMPGTVLLNGGFTRQALTQALAQNRGTAPRYPVVHIASHFSLSSRDTNSFLLLGDGGHLSVAQIKTDPHFFQGVDLLALSACNTAIDVRSTNGREVEGFGALAQRLGARSVLASLWPVADASTPVLMREFYRLRRANPKLSKAAGLRQAQIELLTGKVAASAPPSKTNRAQRAKIAGAANADLPAFKTDPKAPYAHPYYWAPFVLIGSPQ